MPPKTARKSVGPGRRGGRTRGTPAKGQKAAAVQPDPIPDPEESVKPVEEQVEPIEDKKEEAKKVEDVLVKDKIEENLVADNGIDRLNREESEVKVPVEEYENGERLDLEDNDPEESEPEEYVGDDDMAEEVQEEVVDDVAKEVEEQEACEEEEGDIHEGEIEEANDELEPEEEEHDNEHEHEHDVGEHVEIGDADEQEHHDVFKERRKRKEFEVFVGGLDKDANEEDLKKVFSAVGEVIEVRLMMSSLTKKNKGFAFIRFATVEQAKRACLELKNPVVHGKKCGVTPSQDSDTLFLGNICKTWTNEALKEKLKNYGIETVEDLTLVEDNKSDGTNKGFAFLEFSSRSDAMDAYKRLQKRDVTFGVDRPAKVSFADSFVEPGDDIMSQVKTVFVDGLLASWDEARVRELLKKYGNVEKVELARNMPSARRKDYGFITFGTHDAAVICAKDINNEELGEGDKKAKVRARLSRPLQRAKGKHVQHGDFRSGRPATGGFRSPWARARPLPRNLPPRGIRRVTGRLPPVVDRSVRRPVASRARRPAVPLPPRRPVGPPRRPVGPPRRPVDPLPRSYERSSPVPSHTRNNMKRAYSRREELPPRSRVVAEYGPPPPRSTSEKSSSYRENYPTRGPTYADIPRVPSHSSSRGGEYPTRFERPPPSYREGRSRSPRDYEPVPGSKRPYAAMDDVRPRYAEAEVRQSRARMDYEMGCGSSQYGDVYSDRVGRPNIGYGSNRSSMSDQDSHGVYSSSRQGSSYGRGLYNGSDSGGMYSSSYGGDYSSRGSDVGGRSYSPSMYSGRSMGGRGYMGSGSSRSYF